MVQALQPLHHVGDLDSSTAALFSIVMRMKVKMKRILEYKNLLLVGA